MRWRAGLAGLLCSALCAAALQPGDGNEHDVVHLVFSNHVALGFGGIEPELGYDAAVVNKYFDWYLPTAVRLGSLLASRPERHVYTTHSYLISLYLSCPPAMGLHCPSLERQAELREAISAGDVTWTALPHNGHVEAMDSMLLQSAVHLSKYVDAECGMPYKTVISQRGIPGFSRAALDVLVNQEQVRALSVGVDPASAPPGVPHNEPFIWRDDVTGAQLIAMWHPRGYGAMSGPHDAALTPPEECVYSPPDAGTGGRHILCFSWRGTNAGPLPDPDAVLEVHAQARRAFPGADVRASTLEAFVDALELHSSSLKVVTGEVGDTWLPGLASDPQKVQQYRAITRMRSQCLWSESCTAQDPDFRNFTRLLLKVPEQAWGVDTASVPSFAAAPWDTKEFRSQRKHDAALQAAARSWALQADYVLWSMQALEKSREHAAFAAAVRAALDDLQAPHPALQHSAPLHSCDPSARATLAARRLAATADSMPACSEPLLLGVEGWHLAVDPHTGDVLSFRRLWRKRDGSVEEGTDFAANGTFASLLYSTYTEADCKRWAARYTPEGEAASAAPFCKLGSDGDGAKARRQRPRLTGFKQIAGPSEGERDIVLQFSFHGWPTDEAGAPPALHIVFRAWPDAAAVMMDVIYNDKQATRVSEALWLRFQPAAAEVDLDQLMLSKLDAWVSPHDVVANGSFSMHALTDGGVTVSSRVRGRAWEHLQIVGMDAPLVTLGAPQVLPDFQGPAQPQGGFNFCLLNNAWPTNFPQWSPYGMKHGNRIKYRFILGVRDSRETPNVRHMLARDEHLGSLARRTLPDVL